MIFNFLTKEQLSHVGMIIQTTTLDTEEKVKNLYGGNSWTKIEGRMLLGQSDSYAINSTGGSADAVVVSHSHNAVESGNHSHRIAYNAAGSGSGGYLAKEATALLQQYSYALNNTTGYPNLYSTSTDGNHSHTINATGVDGAGKNLPPYKAVYIWERTA